MKYKILIGFIVACSYHGNVMGKILYFVKNNEELQIPSESEFSDIESRLHVILNSYYGGQPFIIRVQFIDVEDESIISAVMEWLGILDAEEDISEAICQDVEILFEWKNNAWVYKKTSFDQSEIAEKMFLPKVKEFISENAFKNITSEREIIRKWLTVINNVLDQQWKEKILAEGEAMVGVQGYQRGHRLAHWMKPDYMYDLEPHLTDSASASDVTYISNAKTNKKDYKEYEFMPTLVKWLSDFDYHNPYVNISEVEDKLFVQTRSRENYESKQPSHDLVASQILSDTSFHIKVRDNETKLYRLKLIEVPIDDNQKYNLFSDLARFGWKHTSCNFFAFDLQKKVFGRFLWPLNCAFGSTAISNYLPTDANFVEVEKEEAYKYSQAGFAVIAIRPGHVTTLYPNEELSIIKGGEAYTRVVQAGSYVGKSKYLNQIWRSSEFGDVKTFVYLGYIIQ